MVNGKGSKKEFLTDVLLEIKMECAMEKCLELMTDLPRDKSTELLMGY